MLLEAIFAVGTIVLTEFVRFTAREVIYQLISSHSKKTSPNHSSNQRSSGFRTNKTTQDITRELEIVDVEVIELECKEQHDGSASQRDRERKRELELLRADKFKEYQDNKAREIAVEQSSNPENYETSCLKNDRVHVLQFHMGQVVLEKKCTCGRLMILQSKKRLDGSLYQLNEFFWSCTGFYNNSLFQCKKGNSLAVA